MKKLLAPLLGVTLLSGCVVVVGDVDDRPEKRFTRNLSIPAGALERLDIEAGAGSLDVTGVPGLTRIEVDAEIWAKSSDEKDYSLSLDGFGRNAELIAKSRNRNGFSYRVGRAARINLTVRVPAEMNLSVDDGSGDISIVDINGKVRVEDGSGRLVVRHVGRDLMIEDGSGDIVVDNVDGNVRITDGSGNMHVSNVAQTLTIDDGSGDIEVYNINDLKIEESGSGDVTVNDAD